MSSPSLDTLANRVAHIHSLSRLDRAEMSKLAGLSRGHVGMLMRETVTRPASATLVKIARTFDVSLEWLLTGKGEGPTEDRVRAAIKAAQSPRPARSASKRSKTTPPRKIKTRRLTAALRR